MLGLLYCFRALFGRGFIRMNFRFWSQLASAPHVLRVLGATIGNNTHIYSDICIYNAKEYNYKNLTVGSSAYIGPKCLFDLTSPITMENEVSISAQTSFITHIDVGTGELRKRIPRQEGPIVVRRGAWVGANTTILHGVTIGEHSAVGAMSLVKKNVPAHSIAYGIPCKVVKRLKPGTPRPLQSSGDKRDSAEHGVEIGPVPTLKGYTE